MASLDVLDHQAALDEALAKAGLEPAYRGQAVKEARRIVEAMAFRFALMDDRPLPEDSDYVRALDALKAPARVAEVLAKRRPIYARIRRRRLTTTYLTLGLVLLFVAGLAYYGTSENAEELALLTHSATEAQTLPQNQTFVVTDDMTRLHIDGAFLPTKGTSGVIEVRLIDPSGSSRLYESYYAGGNIYLRENIYDPEPGKWQLVMDFLDAQGSARVTVDGIRPAR